ncbi:TPA: hypothetical protein SMR42_003179 [Pseudomonas putida]|nr:hypothetical protein [Pseudomonas putida]
MPLFNASMQLPGLAVALLYTGLASAQPADPQTETLQLERRAARCAPHLESLERLLIDKIHGLEPTMGERLRQIPEIEGRIARLRQQLDQERQDYEKLPWRSEYRIRLEALENEIWSNQSAIRSTQFDERDLTVMKPALSSTRQQKSALLQQLDAFTATRHDCEHPQRSPQCYAEEVLPLHPLLKSALDDTHALLETLWSPLSDVAFYSMAWIDDCAATAPSGFGRQPSP